VRVRIQMHTHAHLPHLCFAGGRVHPAAPPTMALQQPGSKICLH